MTSELENLIIALIHKANTTENIDSKEFLRLQHRWRRVSAQPFYTKAEILAALPHHPLWQQLPDDVRKRLRSWCQVKPIRTASGVATVTLLTKPWPCPGECVFCPADIRMPKSYLANEPGAARAESHWFDPFLQLCARLEALQAMGHPLDKVEVIILGGTWDAYPLTYQIWFVSEIYRALNEFGRHQESYRERVAWYRELDERLYDQELVLSDQAEVNRARVMAVQTQIDAGELSYNEAVSRYYLHGQREQILQTKQQTTWERLARLQEENTHSRCRNVGLVIETRPDEVNPERAIVYRRLGCTKIQLGIQSVQDKILARNGRPITPSQITKALAILRLFGFKLHTHFMANLLGAQPESDIEDFREFVTNERYLPDEIKLYPCALIANAPLKMFWQRGEWQPYTEKQLLQVLVADMRVVPRYVRISRMIRDFSADDILSGNKKTNFRQLVDMELTRQKVTSFDIRSREIKNEQIVAADLSLRETRYQTIVSTEYFLEWVTQTDKIVGFLRLSLPNLERAHIYVPPDCDAWNLLDGQTAMIREVHVYGVVSRLGETGQTQHLGLGKKLIARAEEIACEHDYNQLRVISAVGTREYYRKLGFVLDGCYQVKKILAKKS